MTDVQGQADGAELYKSVSSTGIKPTGGDAQRLATPTTLWVCWDCLDRWLVARFVLRLKGVTRTSAATTPILRGDQQARFEWLFHHQGHKKIERLE